ncbi:hypothetical protein HNR32_001894 [Pectinatus brassicae]|uniref:Uncharacterized protein n=1 Tax=Pectinatus brassicae TaxID=862415 RepID=A0A840UKP2_9FIRM|nr:hypothetical protein [Pectinatus brassicae]
MKNKESKIVLTNKKKRFLKKNPGKKYKKITGAILRE